MSEIKIAKCIMTANPCYKAGRRITPKGIVVHSTGANNAYIRRYVQPDDGVLGKNKYNNHWNKSNANKCVHAFIGKVDDGSAAIYQTLPWDYRAWGVGSGKKGSYNASHIQFEICEDNLSNADYYNEVFGLAAKLCAYLCKEYDIPVSNVVGHYEAHAAGYGNNHGDPRNWQRKFGDSMDAFRQRVAALIGGVDINVTIPAAKPEASTAGTTTLRKGSDGAAVEEMQKLLMKHGYSLPKYGADGDFGNETLTAVKAFQEANGLDVDGAVGPITWAALRTEPAKQPVYTVQITGLTLAKANEIIAKYGGTKEVEAIAV